MMEFSWIILISLIIPIILSMAGNAFIRSFFNL
jgi:hypothetical protein